MKKSAILLFVLLFIPLFNLFSQGLVQISGKITHNGVGLSGVTVSLAGSTSGTFITDASGDYSFPALAGGNYTVTPNKTGYIFSPGSKTFIAIAADEVQNFVTVVPTNTISGNITFNGSPLDSVIVTFSGSTSGADTTDATGNFSLTVNTGGNYTITPMRQGYLFTPAFQVYSNITTNQVQNFTAAVGSYTLAGRISVAGVGLNGVTIILSGTGSDTVVTDTTGNYSFPILIGGNYTVTPAKQGYTFNPASRTFTNATGNLVQDFIGLPDLPDAPTLSSPVNGTSNLGTAVNLIWNASPGAVTYNLQVSTSAGFGTLFYSGTNMFATAYGLSGLQPGTTYYWRVSSNNTSGTSGWSTVWNFSTQQTITDAPVLSSPLNNAVNIPTSTNLSWNAVTGATIYTVQVSQSADFSSFVVNNAGVTSTSLNVASLNYNTKYYWRVNASNGGTTSQWSQVWNFTTVPNAPGIPTLLSPANSTLNVPLTTDISWNQVSGATFYNLQIATNANFAPVAYNISNLTGTTYNIAGLANNTTYYWRVSAGNGAGTSAYSGIWSFTTIAAIPQPPVLLSPANGQTNVSINPLITWGGVLGAMGYDLQVSVYPDFATYAINEIGMIATAYQLNALYANRNYYWRVRSRNAAGVSAWSQSMFTTRQALTGPTLLQPANNTRLTSNDVFFSWTSMPTVTYYEFIISQYADFRNAIANPKTLTSPAMNIFGLESSTTYYWKVRGIQGAEIGEWSELFAFTTPSRIKGPKLTSPKDDAYGIGTTVLFKWEGISEVQGYDLQIAKDPGFTDVISNVVGITENYQSVSNLSTSSTLYWRVRGWKVTDIGQWSTPWRFQTASSAVERPLITYPPNDRVNVSINTVLRWSAVPGATAYEVILADDPELNNIVSSFVGLASNSVSVFDLGYKKTYYWKVLARIGNSTSEWTPVFKFTTHDVGVGVKPLDGLADRYELSQNYPNPFNPSTNINYSISENSMVTLKIYDIYGREVETLVNEPHSIGKYSASWEPKNMPSGVYYYQIRAGKFNEVRKMIYLR